MKARCYFMGEGLAAILDGKVLARGWTPGELKKALKPQKVGLDARAPVVAMCDCGCMQEATTRYSMTHGQTWSSSCESWASYAFQFAYEFGYQWREQSIRG